MPEAHVGARIGQQLVWNSGLAAGARILSAATSLAAVPVVVDKLGLAGFGTWEALLAIASLAGMFQSAVSGALLWRQSEAYGRGDLEGAARWVRFGMTATALLFLVLVPSAWLARKVIVSALNVPMQYAPTAIWLLPSLVAVIVLGAIADTLESVVSGFQSAGMVSLTTAAALMVNYALVIAGVLAGLGLASCLLGAACGVIVRACAAHYLARRSIGRFSLVPGPPPRTSRATLRYSGLLLVGYVSAALKDPTDKIILASLASPSWTGYYGIASRLAGLALEFTRFFYFPLLAAVAAMNARGSWDAVRRMYDAMMTVVPAVSGCVVVVVAGLYDRLLVLWIGRNVPEVATLLLLLLTGNAFGVMLTGPGTSLSRGIGKVWIETMYILVNLALNLVLTAVLVVLVGPVGTVIASGAAWTASSVVFALVLHRVLDLPGAATRRAALALACVPVAAAVTRFASSAFPASVSRPDALQALLGLGALSVAVYVVLLGLTGVVSRTTISNVISVFGDRNSGR